ncbi:MAG: glycosyl hydrolase, partial [Saprospiraceae bacterium]|nr:glycosyl hydrolase [Saprospiraceae bacterium]
VSSIMNAFNELNGVPATGDSWLQRDILKVDWGFEGVVLSDWASIRELVVHGYARDRAHAAEIASKAGSDVDMESYVYVDHLVKLVEEGKVPVEVVDDAVRRILKMKFNLGLFDDPYRYCNVEREQAVTGSDEIMEGALEMAKKSIVLLKNEDSLLPLKKSGQKVLLLGQLAESKNSPLGSWRLASIDQTAISVLEGMQEYTGNELRYMQGPMAYKGQESFLQPIRVNDSDRTGLEEAVAAAAEADVVVMVLGEHGFQSGEGRSITDLSLPGLQEEFLKEVYEANKNVVLVLNNGRPLAIEWADENITAIVEAWQLGTQTGHAVASILYGDYNPSGKLPMTFPRNVGQVPIYYNHKSSGRPFPQPIVFWSQYIDVPNSPLYPFGYGLSYTSFEYSELQTKVTDDGVEVSVNLTNTGSLEGEEVAQVYIRDKTASVTRPVKELKGFSKVALQPGEMVKLIFKLGREELGFYNNQGKYIVESGAYDIMVGGNSRDLISQEVSINWK